MAEDRTTEGSTCEPDESNASNEKLTATAYHEAGHAVVALSLGRPIKKVTIQAGNSQAGDRMLGSCQIQKGRTKPSKTAFEDEILILFAGMVAESMATGQYCPRGAGLDLRMTRRMLASRGDSERQIEKQQRRLLDKTENLLDQPSHTAAVKSIAEELIRNKTISGRAAKHFFQQAVDQNK